MNVQKFLAAATVFVAAGSAFAADAPAASAAVSTAAATSITTATASAVFPAAGVNLPTVIVTKQGWSTRAITKAEAIEFAHNYKTAFEVLIEQYKN